MMLFLREQVEAYAFSEKKWGSAAALDEEFARRETSKKQLKNKKFEAQLKELRKKTRSNVWHRRQEDIHVHSFVNVAHPPDSLGVVVQKCSGCGLQNEVETF
jgi:DNA-repair protein complementing XP-A cells